MKETMLNKRKCVFCVLNILITLAYMVPHYADFIADDKLNLTRLGFTVVTAVIICLAACIRIDIKNDKLKTVGRWFLIAMMPLLLLAVVMQNYHIMMFRAWLLNYSLYLILFALAFTITGSCGVAVVVVGVLTLVSFTINTEVTLFRGAPIVPSDMYSIRTAIAVSENYTMKFTYPMFCSLQGMVLACVLAFRANVKIRGARLRAVSIVATVVVSCAYLVGINTYFTKKPPTSLKYERYDTYLSNERFGTLSTFCYNVSNMFIKKPDGYSKQAAEDILDAQTQQEASDSKKPNIVVIMDESFSDLTGVYDINTSVPMLSKFRALSENTIKGNMLVSVYGGNTCVTEFEFLTGLTSGIFKDDTVAYTQCVRKPVHSLCNDLKDIGYKTIAIHPYWKNSWNRGSVYPLLGFDETIFAENFGTEEVNSINFLKRPDMGDYDYLRGYLTDEECFKKVEEQFENKSEDERLFVFNVTIQNHGGYAAKDFESEVTATDMNNSSLDQYLTLTNKTDTAFADMVEYFKNYDEPTVIVYFGDHQPSIKFERNAKEEYKYLGNDAKYIVPFRIWANYNIEEKEVELTSPAYLSLMLKEVADLPENKWDSFRKQLSEKYPAFTLRTAYDTNKNAVKKEDMTDELYQQYKILQYGILFDEVKP